ATSVSLANVSSDSTPRITLRYKQAKAEKENVVQWNGERFALAGPPPAAQEDLLAELDRQEAALFQLRDYSRSLEELNAFEQRVRSATLPEEEKTKLLLELFYHQALCYRKLGQSDRAAVMYSALWRGHPQESWGQLAQQWIRFDSVRNR